MRKALKDAWEIAQTDYVIEYAGNPVKVITKVFRETANRAGLPGVTAHVLRHTAATHMAKAGVAMWEIAGMLGHRSSHTTEKVYAKHHPDFLKRAAKALEKVG